MRDPDKIALICGDQRLTYLHLVDRIDRVAVLTRSHFKLKKGDRAAIVAGNCLEYIEIVDGLSEAGVAAATCNPRQTPAEIGFILNDCSARVAFVAPETEPIVTRRRWPTLEQIVVIGLAYETLIGPALRFGNSR